MTTWTKENHPVGFHSPKGSRNKLAKHVFDDLVEFWNESISQGSDIRRGPAALRIMSRQNPRDFCKLYANLMPRELWLESTAQELSDEELDRVIQNIRQRLLEQREERALDQVTQIKLVEHVS